MYQEKTVEEIIIDLTNVEMPSPTASKRHKGVYLLTSSTTKISISVLDAVAPLLLLRLQWPQLLKNPADTLTSPLLPSLFIVQTVFIVLLLPLPYSSTKQSRKRGIVKVDTLGEAIQSKVMVISQLTETILTLATLSIAISFDSRYNTTVYNHRSLWRTSDNSHCRKLPHGYTSYSP